MFDRNLSLAIDAIHDELERLRTVRRWPGAIWARLRCIYLRWKLRQLERTIP